MIFVEILAALIYAAGISLAQILFIRGKQFNAPKRNLMSAAMPAD